MPDQNPLPPTKAPPGNSSPKFHFKWWIVFVPLTLGLLLWIGQGLKPTFDWGDVLFFLHIANRDRFTELAVFMVLAIAFVIILKVVRDRDSGGQS